MVMLFILLGISLAQAADCDKEFLKAVEEGPIDSEQIRYRMKCLERAGGDERSYICAIGGMPKADERRNFGRLPVTALYAPNGAYPDITGLWHPHKGRYRSEKNEVTDVTVTANNFGMKVIKKKRSTVEKILLSELDDSLSYEKTKETGRPPEKIEFSCSQFVADDPDVEPEKKKSRWGNNAKGGGVPGQATPTKRGNGPNKSGVSGTY